MCSSDLVALTIGSKKLSMGPGGVRQLSCLLHLKNQRLNESNVRLRLIVGLVEADEDKPVVDPTLVRLLSVQDHHSVTIWRSDGEESQVVEIDVATKSFPLKLVISHRESVAVGVDAKARRL